jgi:hypothetical protein
LTTLREEAKARNATLICSLHQVELALSHFPRIVALRDGRIAFDLPREQVTPQMIAALYQGRPAASPAPATTRWRSNSAWVPVMTAALDSRRDPALRGRLLAILAALVVLWPTLVVTEFKPWILLDEQSLSATGRFLADFLVPRTAQFLDMLLRETWNTVAIATAGLTLALLGAIPATLIINEQLSISMLGTGRMRLVARAVRQLVRWLLVLLRSVPNWCGRCCSCASSAWGRPPACWPSPSPTAACWARSTPKSSNPPTPTPATRCWPAAPAAAGAVVRRCRKRRRNSCPTPSTAGSARSAARW